MIYTVFTAFFLLGWCECLLLLNTITVYKIRMVVIKINKLIINILRGKKLVRYINSSKAWTQNAPFEPEVLLCKYKSRTQKQAAIRKERKRRLGAKVESTKMGWVWKDDNSDDVRRDNSSERCATTKVVKSQCRTEEVETGKFVRKCEKTEEILRNCIGKWYFFFPLLSHLFKKNNILSILSNLMPYKIRLID